MRVQAGMVRVCLEPVADEPLVPDSWCDDELMNLAYVESIEQSGASGYLIIACFSSIARMEMWLPSVIYKINDVFAQHQKRPTCKLDICDESGEIRSSGEAFCNIHAYIADEGDP